MNHSKYVLILVIAYSSPVTFTRVIRASVVVGGATKGAQMPNGYPPPRVKDITVHWSTLGASPVYVCGCPGVEGAGGVVSRGLAPSVYVAALEWKALVGWFLGG